MKKLWTVGCLLAVSAVTRVQAQSEPDPSQYGGAQVGDESAGAPTAETESGSESSPPTDGTPQSEGPHTPRKWSFGAYFRYGVVPSFMLKLFVDAAPSVSMPAGGIFADYKPGTDGPTIEMGIGYTDLSFAGVFRAKGDPLQDSEWQKSTLGLVHLTGSMLWDAPISSRVTFQYGFGLDLGVVTGQLRRSEAYRDLSGRWGPCAGALSPNFAVNNQFYCELPTKYPSDAYNEKGAQYNQQEKRVPPIAPMLMLPHLAVRYAPIDDVVLKLDAAYGIFDFWFGLSAAYAPPL